MPTWMSGSCHVGICSRNIRLRRIPWLAGGLSALRSQHDAFQVPAYVRRVALAARIHATALSLIQGPEGARVDINAAIQASES